MTREKFRKILNRKKQIDLNIEYKIPDLKGVFKESYSFKMFKNGKIKSYMDGKFEFVTNMISHMYFIYRKVLTRDKIYSLSNKGYIIFGGGKDV